jgi:hypothetical protein
MIEVENKICAAVGCNRLATRSIIFRLGFSANFCDECTKNWFKQENKNGLPTFHHVRIQQKKSGDVDNRSVDAASNIDHQLLHRIS